MKRKILLIYLLLFLFPIFVEAKVCIVVSGTGNNVGDEIACGSEHFYVIEKNEDKAKLITKYNLYVGDKIEKDDNTYVLADYPDEYDAYLAVEARCDELQAANPGSIVEITGKYATVGEATEYFCRIYTPLEYDKVKQNELAIGLYPKSDTEIMYPIYGSLYLDDEAEEHEYDGNLDMIPETSQFSTYFADYKETLEELGVNVLDIGFIKKSGLENLINSVSDNKITIPTYSPSDPNVEPEDNVWSDDMYFSYQLFAFKYNIKEFVPENYKWIYGTSYWIGSATMVSGEGWKDYFDEFLSTVGDYCSYGRGCHYSKMGLGLRPVVTIDNSEIDIPINYDYKFIKGDNQKLIINNIKEYTFTIDGDYSLFESLKIGNLDLIKDEDYEVTEGSTVITFTKKGLAKLNTLVKGEYELNVKYSNNKEVKGKLIIKQPDTDINEENSNTIDKDEKQLENPKTGDTVDKDEKQLENPKIGDTVDKDEKQLENPKTGDTVDKDEKQLENPKTGDNVVSYLIIGNLSLISLAGCSLYLNRKSFN